MTDSIKLKGMAWDHPRGYEPLRAIASEFTRLIPEVEIEWSVRTLKEFGDMPIEDLIESYDIITIDHPYMGQAHENKLLVPLEEWLPKTTLKKLEKESVGPSFKSYCYEGHQYALPVDAAALVAAQREDLVSQLRLELPNTRKELLDFYHKTPNSHKVAWALCPTDIWCTFLTLCAQDSNGGFIKGKEINNFIGEKVLDELKQHLRFLHPKSLEWNPIQILDCMSNSNELIYAPFLFGYTNYARKGYAKYLVGFGNSPKSSGSSLSTILGGVGLAISAKSSYKEQAVAYVNYVASAEVQKGIYTQHGGQPGNFKAWQSEANNRLCNDFFSNTAQTMNNAYVRPQHPGWNTFQEKGADLIHEGLVKNTPSDKIIKNLNQLYQTVI